MPPPPPPSPLDRLRISWGQVSSLLSSLTLLLAKKVAIGAM